VAELGPRAAAWAVWLRATYPDPSPHGIARLAVRDARRAGWGLAVAEAGGPVAVAVSLAAGAWVRGMLVLRIAAAYGHDPTDPRRARELLELLGLAHPSPARPSPARPVGQPARPVGQLARPPVGLTQVAVRLVATRLAVRAVGLRGSLAAAAVRVLIAASDHPDRLSQLADRAARFYRAAPAGAGQPGRASSTRASSESISARNSP
jgi:hypothetical protein